MFTTLRHPTARVLAAAALALFASCSELPLGPRTGIFDDPQWQDCEVIDPQVCEFPNEH